MQHEIGVFDSAIRLHGKRITEFLIDGLKSAGVRVHKNVPTQNVAVWGWGRGRSFRLSKKNVLVLERAYLGDRINEWVSVGWNGLNGRADFCVPENPTLERFQKYFTLKPWKTGGDKIIIMGQVRGDASLRGKDLTGWYESIAKELEEAHGVPVFFRGHPKANTVRKNFLPRIPAFKGTFEDALEQALCVVSFNSNAAVDAVVAGVPAMSFDKGSMAYDVTSHDVRGIICPDREEWAARLAWCQMRPHEIESGEWVERFFANISER